MSCTLDPDPSNKHDLSPSHFSPPISFVRFLTTAHRHLVKRQLLTLIAHLVCLQQFVRLLLYSPRDVSGEICQLLLKMFDQVPSQAHLLSPLIRCEANCCLVDIWLESCMVDPRTKYSIQGKGVTCLLSMGACMDIKDPVCILMVGT